MSRLGARGLGFSTLGNYSMVLGQSVRTLLVARVLGPADFGVLNIANIATNFTMYSDLGTGMAGEQSASQARGRGRHEEAVARLVDTSRARIWSSVVLALLLLPVAGVLAALGRDLGVLAVLFIAVSGPLQMLWFACRGWLRVIAEFRLAMWAQLTQVAVWALVVPVCAWQWGLLGAMSSMAGSYLPPVLLSLARVPVGALVRPSRVEFTRLVRAGLPVWAMAVSSFLMIYVDQVLAGSLLGTQALGLYAIAMLTTNALLALSDGAAAAAHPQTLEAYGRSNRLTPDEPSVVRVMHVVEVIFSALVPLSWLGMVLVSGFFLTDYRAAMPLVAVLGPVAVLLGIPTASNAALLAVGLHRRLPRAFLGSAAIKVVVALLLVQVSSSPLVIGIASWVGTLVYAVWYLVHVTAALELAPHERTGFVLEHLRVPLLLSVAAAAACAAYASSGLTGFAAVAGATLVLAGVPSYLQFRRSTETASAA